MIIFFFYIFFKIQIIGTRGNGFKGDIAIDDVRVTDGQCGKFNLCLNLEKKLKPDYIYFLYHIRNAKQCAY